VRVVDANVLLYAVNADTAHHQASHRWLNAALAGGDTVAFSWTVLTAFVRISTKVGLFPHPLSPDDAMAQVENWLRAPGATVVHPSSAHLGILTRLLLGVGTGGNRRLQQICRIALGSPRRPLSNYPVDGEPNTQAVGPRH
jgi:toxin-antitoxin system PIN domain toxin